MISRSYQPRNELERIIANERAQIEVSLAGETAVHRPARTGPPVSELQAHDPVSESPDIARRGRVVPEVPRVDQDIDVREAHLIDEVDCLTHGGHDRRIRSSLGPWSESGTEHLERQTHANVLSHTARSSERVDDQRARA
jgi:hypothetical protein